jgi:hypothetical protein
MKPNAKRAASESISSAFGGARAMSNRNPIVYLLYVTVR